MKGYQRNLIKEKIQDYVLNFVYNDKDYKNLIFTGGTCLRKLYNLPRLSEDLDFNYQFGFDIGKFGKKIKKYFQELKKYDLKEIKLANNQRTLFLKFSANELLPISKSITVSPTEKIFVRCDFSKTANKTDVEVNSYSYDKYSFFILSYNLQALFTNKLLAFLERKFFRGKEQNIAFKGRDLFDIVWFINLSSKSGFDLKPNWKTILKHLNETNKGKVIKKIIDKVNKIEKKDAQNDLSPFVESRQYLDDFLNNYKTIIQTKIRYLI